jgi:hypothetical protein
MFAGGMFPTAATGHHTPPPSSLGAAAAHHSARHPMDTHAQQAAFYGNQHQATQPMLQLQQLTQRFELLPPSAVQHAAPPGSAVSKASPPPSAVGANASSQRGSNSSSKQSGSKSRGSSSSAASSVAVAPQHHPGLATLPGYGYPVQGGVQRTGTSQRHNYSSLMQYNAMQYNAMQYNAMLNPALVNQMYSGHYDPQRGAAASTQMYGYGSPYYPR